MRGGERTGISFTKRPEGLEDDGVPGGNLRDVQYAAFRLRAGKTPALPPLPLHSVSGCFATLRDAPRSAQRENQVGV